MFIAVKHLIDDTTAGGINRMLEHVISCPQLAKSARHKIERVKRGRLSAPRLEADIIVSHLSLSWANLPLLTTLRALHPNTPIIHVEHSYCERFIAAHIRQHSRFEALMRICLSLMDHIVAVSQEQGNWLVRRRFCSSDKLSIINPAVDLKRFLDIAPRHCKKQLRIGAIGRLDCQKGFDILINGFMQTSRADLELHIFGQGPDENMLRELATNHPRITFHGFTSDVPFAMESCDMVAMPSRWEPYGLVAMEAMAASRPVLTTKTDGLATHIHNGATDIGENSAAGWAAALEKTDFEKLTLHAANLKQRALEDAGRFSHAWTNLLAQMNAVEADHMIAA